MPLRAVATLLALSLAPPALAESVKFTFAPPVGRTLEMKAIGTGTIKWGGNKEVMSAGHRATHAWAKVDGGYRVTERTLEVALALDGKPVDSPMLAKLAENRLVYRAAANGALRSVDGPRENLQRILPLLEGESKKSAEKRLEENRFGDSERAGWFELVEILAGQTLELDRDYWLPSATTTDDGWARHEIVFRLGPWEETAHGRLLRWRGAFVRSALAEIPGAVRLAPKVRGLFDPEAPGDLATGYSITGNFSRLIDPATMTIYRDQVYRREAHEIKPVEAIGITFVVEERLDATYTPVAP
jgi:hypothetical protein